MPKGQFTQTPRQIAGLKKCHTLGYGRLTPRLAPTEQATPHGIIWAAGIYEGEGYCQSTHTTTISIAQKDTWILYRLKALFGGSICKGPTGCHHWTIYGARARGFSMSIYGLLSPWRQAQMRKARMVSCRTS